MTIETGGPLFVVRLATLETIILHSKFFGDRFDSRTSTMESNRSTLADS